MSTEKTRILAELSRSVGNRRVHDWLLGGTAVASLLSVVTSFANTSSALQHAALPQTVVEQLANPTPLVASVENDVFFREDRVRPGDTISTLIRRLGIDDSEADTFLRSDPVAKSAQSRLKTGQLVSARFKENGELQGLLYPIPGSDRAVSIERSGTAFSAAETALPLQIGTQSRSGLIRSSLFAAADEVDLPDAVAIQLADIFGGEIDFHTDLRRGDRFSVIYESFAHDGREVKTGRVLAAEFVNRAGSRRAIWFDGGSGASGYFTPEGRSLKAAFLRSPLEFSRISSGFSMRLHPILGEWRAHKGVDYAAPIGTSVRATADGHIEYIGKQRGYGNFIVLRHKGKYSTAYGHLNGFAPDLRRGGRVAQGDVIGYVGRTGWATGPHLHYEFRIADVHQDPLSVALPLAQPLSAAQLDTFRNATRSMLVRLDLVDGVKTARAE